MYQVHVDTKLILRLIWFYISRFNIRQQCEHKFLKLSLCGFLFQGYNNIFNYLKQDNVEGFSEVIYNDNGYPAIGYGHRLTSKAEVEKYKNGITQEEAEDLLAKDIMEAENNVRVVYNKFIKDKGSPSNWAFLIKSSLQSSKQLIRDQSQIFGCNCINFSLICRRFLSRKNAFLQLSTAFLQSNISS